jgi:hypothetical protein
LEQQPTIIFQLIGDEIWNQQTLNASTTGYVVGLAGDLDKEYPLDVLLAIPPEHYYEFDDSAGGYIARFYDDDGSGGVIGANAMMGHDVYFDVENNRIGWAESDCNYTALVKQYTDGESDSAANANQTESTSGGHGDVTGEVNGTNTTTERVSAAPSPKQNVSSAPSPKQNVSTAPSPKQNVSTAPSPKQVSTVPAPERASSSPRRICSIMINVEFPTADLSCQFLFLVGVIAFLSLVT